MDEEKLLDLLEMQLALLVKKGSISDARMKRMEEVISTHHAQLDERIAGMDPDALKQMAEHRLQRELWFKKRYPQAYQKFMEERSHHRRVLAKMHPEMAEQIQAMRERFQNGNPGGETPVHMHEQVSWEELIRPVIHLLRLRERRSPFVGGKGWPGKEEDENAGTRHDADRKEDREDVSEGH